MNPAIFSIIGLVIGASLQYFFTRHLDNQKHRRETRTTAYTDYLKCVSEQANLGKQRQSQEGQSLVPKRRMPNAVSVCMASSSAVETFAEFERRGATMNTPEQCSAFTRMVAVMRKDSIGGRQVALGDLESVFLGASHRAA